MATSRLKRENVGVIGLGIIGSRVAENLRKKGFRVFVWNRTPKPVPNFVGAPAELAEMCNYIQLFVSDDQALLKAVQELTPALAPRHVVIAHSTVAPATMGRAADLVEYRGARFVEAPFTGSKLAAEKAELLYYVGGDEIALREARPILEASSKEIMVIGSIGQATAVKIATNIVTAASVQATAEALALVQSVGLPVDKFVEALRGNASNSTTLAMKLPKMVEGNFEPHFSLKHMLKDIEIAAKLAATHQLDLSVTTAARDRLREQMAQGRGEEDYSALARKYFSPDESAVAPAPEVVPTEPEAPEPVPAAAAIEPDKPNSFVPMMPDIEKEDMEEASAGVWTPLEPIPVSAAPVVAQQENTPGDVVTTPSPDSEQTRQNDLDFLTRLFTRTAEPDEPPAASSEK